MKQLLIMRHAKSSWKDETLTDHDRPLNKRGNATAPLMGSYVAKKECLPDLILSSTANRAISTAELFVQGAEKEIPIITQRALYHPDVHDYCETVSSKTNDEFRVMVVSHNPGSSEWIYQLTGQYESMPTAAIGIVEFDDDFQWAAINQRSKAELLDVWRPKEVLDY